MGTDRIGPGDDRTLRSRRSIISTESIGDRRTCPRATLAAPPSTLPLNSSPPTVPLAGTGVREVAAPRARSGGANPGAPRCFTHSQEQTSKPRTYKEGQRVLLPNLRLRRVEVIVPCTGASSGQVLRCCGQENDAGGRQLGPFGFRKLRAATGAHSQPRPRAPRARPAGHSAGAAGRE